MNSPIKRYISVLAPGIVRKLTFAILLIVLGTLVKAQPTPLEQVQRNALIPLRGFRDILNPQRPNPAADSLFGYTIQLINVAKTQNDTAQLLSLTTYFNTALASYKSADSKGKSAVVANLNRDLSLKIHTKERGQLNLENYESLFNDAKVAVLVDINGIKQSTGKYTLFWAPFTGEDQHKIISSGAHSGSSSNSTNPYNLVIKLPGYITFWIEETTSGKIYRSNPEYYTFRNSDDQGIEVNFVP
jgi:hypothetical protein